MEPAEFSKRCMGVQGPSLMCLHPTGCIRRSVPHSNEDPAQPKINKQRVKSPPFTEYGPPARRSQSFTWSSWQAESSAPGRVGPPRLESRWVLTVLTLGVKGGSVSMEQLGF